jgi:hypothetical protein
MVLKRLELLPNLIKHCGCYSNFNFGFSKTFGRKFTTNNSIEDEQKDRIAQLSWGVKQNEEKIDELKNECFYKLLDQFELNENLKQRIDKLENISYWEPSELEQKEPISGSCRERNDLKMRFVPITLKNTTNALEEETFVENRKHRKIVYAWLVILTGVVFQAIYTSKQENSAKEKKSNQDALVKK